MAKKRIRYHNMFRTIEQVCREKRQGHLVEPLLRWWTVGTSKFGVPVPVIFASALCGEVSVEGDAGRDAVAGVMLRRVLLLSTDTIDDVLIVPYQFSCFNRGSSHTAMMNSCPEKYIVFWIERAINYLDSYNAGTFSPPIDDATLYCTKDALTSLVHRWAERRKGGWNLSRVEPRGLIGSHYFFAEV